MAFVFNKSGSVSIFEFPSRIYKGQNAKYGL